MSKKTKTAKKSLMFLVFPMVLAVYFCVVIIQQQVTISQLSDKADAIRNEIKVQSDLKMEIETEMKSENEIKRVEKIAREKLGLLKENERLFVDSAR